MYVAIKTQEVNTDLLQHKPQYRAEWSDSKKTKADLSPQFNALHSFQRSYNATRKEQETNSRNKKHNIFTQKQIAGLGNTKVAR